MVTINEQRLDELCVRHDVRVLRLFGSVVRGKDHSDSDIDIIVEFVRPKGFFDLQKRPEIERVHLSTKQGQLQP